MIFYSPNCSELIMKILDDFYTSKPKGFNSLNGWMISHLKLNVKCHRHLLCPCIDLTNTNNESQNWAKRLFESPLG